MQTFERNLTKTDVRFGLISLAGFKREDFPDAGEKIIVYDDEGRKYITKMHSEVARIDGLTEWHKNHSTKIGDVVEITINLDGSIKISLKKEPIVIVPSRNIAVLNLLDQKSQIIFYGPPGTGKTYKAREISVNFIEETS